MKKCAAMLSFSGKNYHGMQRNQVGELKTIESELLAALAKAGTIDPQWEHTPAKAFFTRASRTDKGVSAARERVPARPQRAWRPDATDGPSPRALGR